MAGAERGLSSPLRIVRVPGKGRGIVAGRSLAEGEVLEIAPVVVIPAGQWPLAEQTILGRFCFTWDEERGSAAVALGRGSLFNHSYTPNVAADKTVSTRVIRFVAVRDIERGEELTINYLGEPDSRGPVGFDVKDP
jgi:hypothetical protein